MSEISKKKYVLVNILALLFFVIFLFCGETAQARVDAVGGAKVKATSGNKGKKTTAVKKSTSATNNSSKKTMTPQQEKAALAKDKAAKKATEAAKTKKLEEQENKRLINKNKAAQSTAAKVKTEAANKTKALISQEDQRLSNKSKETEKKAAAIKAKAKADAANAQKLDKQESQRLLNKNKEAEKQAASKKAELKAKEEARRTAYSQKLKTLVAKENKENAQKEKTKSVRDADSVANSAVVQAGDTAEMLRRQKNQYAATKEKLEKSPNSADLAAQASKQKSEITETEKKLGKVNTDAEKAKEYAKEVYVKEYGLSAYGKKVEAEKDKKEKIKNELIKEQKEDIVRTAKEKAAIQTAKEKPNAPETVGGLIMSFNPILGLVSVAGTLAGGGTLKEAFDPNTNIAIVSDSKFQKDVVTNVGNVFDAPRVVVSVPAAIAANIFGSCAGGDCPDLKDLKGITKSSWKETGAGAAGNLAKLQVEGKGPLAGFAKDHPTAYNEIARVVTNPVEVYGMVTGGAALHQLGTKGLPALVGVVRSGGVRDLVKTAMPNLGRVTASLADDSGFYARDLFNPMKWAANNAADDVARGIANGADDVAKAVTTKPATALQDAVSESSSLSQLASNIRNTGDDIAASGGRRISAESTAKQIEQIRDRWSTGYYIEHPSALDADLATNITSNGGLRAKVRDMLGDQRIIYDGPASAPVRISNLPAKIPNFSNSKELSSYVRSIDNIKGKTGAEVADKIDDIVEMLVDPKIHNSHVRKYAEGITRDGGLRETVLSMIDGYESVALKSASKGQLVNSW